MTKLFISYRRDDSAAYAGQISDRLAKECGSGVVFLDVEAIYPGVDFEKKLREAVASCDVLLVIIGSDWLNARDENGVRRLENAKDFVRIEVSTGLQRGTLVVPLLLDGTRMPKREELPTDLHDLVTRNAFEVRHSSFHPDIGRLVELLKDILPTPAGAASEERDDMQKPKVSQSGKNNIAIFGDNNQASIVDRERLLLNREQQDKLADRLSAFAGRRIKVFLNHVTTETEALSKALVDAFGRAKLLVVEVAYMDVFGPVPPGVSFILTKMDPMDAQFAQTLAGALVSVGLVKDKIQCEYGNNDVFILYITPLQ